VQATDAHRTLLSANTVVPFAFLMISSLLRSEETKKVASVRVYVGRLSYRQIIRETGLSIVVQRSDYVVEEFLPEIH
jgi:hypothetical protein